MKEEWKDIVIEQNGIIYDYTGLYEVSNYGRVRNKKQKLKRSSIKENGYMTVILWKNNKEKNFYVHRLVATMFIENDNPIEKTQVNHKDFNRQNNSVENLEWVSHKENMQHAFNADEEHGNERRHRISETVKGSKNPNSKKVLCIETEQIFNSMKEASEWIGVSYTNISNCCNGKQKTCGGYHWRYVN